MNQKDFANIILIVVIVILVGAVGYFAFVKKSEPVAQQPTPPITTQTPTPQQPSPTPVNETANWKTYRNDEYGFEVKYPNKDYNVFETKPNLNYGDKFSLDIDIGRNDGSFKVEITISESISRNSSRDDLQSEIMKWYGVFNWPLNFPTADAQINEFSIDNHLAIKSNYIARGEGVVADPAVQIFTLSSQYIYKIDYIGDIKEGDLILSTFKFLK